MHDLSKHLPTPLMKGQEYDEEDQAVRVKELSKNEICVATKDGLPTSVQDKLEDKDKDYCSMTHEKYCDLLSAMEENITEIELWL